jgi:hypothetical protein
MALLACLLTTYLPMPNCRLGRVQLIRFHACTLCQAGNRALVRCQGWNLLSGLRVSIHISASEAFLGVRVRYLHFFICFSCVSVCRACGRGVDRSPILTAHCSTYQNKAGQGIFLLSPSLHFASLLSTPASSITYKPYTYETLHLYNKIACELAALAGKGVVSRASEIERLGASLSALSSPFVSGRQLSLDLLRPAKLAMVRHAGSL